MKWMTICVALITAAMLAVVTTAPAAEPKAKTRTKAKAKAAKPATPAAPALPRPTGPNLVVNGDFAQKTDAGLPAGWTPSKSQKVAVVAEDALAGVGQSLRVDVLTDGGGTLGDIGQIVKVKPDTVYRLGGKVRSTQAGLALLAIKLRQGGKEIQRLGLGGSGTEWTETSKEFPTGDADEIQVSCRWSQNAARGALNQTAWFADVWLAEVGKAPPAPPWVEAQRKARQVKPASPPELPLKATAADLFITPDGAGTRDGSSWANALPGNAPGVLQAAWDALAPGRAVRVGSGIYLMPTLTAATGGTGPDKMKRLTGEDTGGGLPWLVGDWSPAKPAEGRTFLALSGGADYIAFENLQLTRYQFGIVSRKGGHVGLRITNVDAYETRHGVYLCGFAYADAPDAASHDIEIRDCEFIHFTKNAVRFQAGNYDVRLINLVADAGGPEWMREAFHICYNIGGDAPRRRSGKDDKPWASEHDIIYINCVARNAYYSRAHFWQGDGYTAEGGNRNIAFINCEAWDNADGGWDVKAENLLFVNCRSVRNKMNWRLRQPTLMANCLSAHSFKRGGSWISTGLWAVGDVFADHCTFHNNSTHQLSPDKKETSGEASISLEHCLVSFDAAAHAAGVEGLYTVESRVKKIDTAEWCPKTEAGEARGPDPQYVAADKKAWNGDPVDAFDSRLYGPAKGFNSSVYNAWKKMPPEQLVEIARQLLKHKGWEDFKAQTQKATEKSGK